MSISKRIAFGAAASWFSRCITIFLGLVMMPVLFRHLPKEELGIWLLLGQSWAALGILDLGFGPTLTRRIAFAKGKSGCDPNVPLTDDTLRDIANLVATGRVIYRFLAVGAFLIAFGSGFFYLRSLELNTLSLSTVWLAWAVICLSQGVNVWGAIWDCLLQGVGYVGWDAIIGSCISTLTLIAQIVAILLGASLVSLAVIAAVGAITQRFVLRRFSKSKRPELFQVQGKFDGDIVRGIVPLAVKAWITTLGLVVVTNSDQFFIAGMKGVSEIPAYRAAYIVFVNFNMIAGTFASASAVFVAHLWQAGELTEIHRIVIRNLRMGLGIMVATGACVLALGESFFNLWLGHGNYIGMVIMSIFFILQVLELQSYIISTSSRATEDEAYATWSVMAAILKIALAFILGARWGLTGIALSTLLAQLFTSHWYMVYRGLRRLEMSFSQHVYKIVLPVAVLFAAVFGSVRGLRVLFPSSSDWTRVLGGAAVSGLILALTLFFLVLDTSQRNRILRRTAGSLRVGG